MEEPINPQERRCARWVVDSALVNQHCFPLQPALYEMTVKQMYVKNITDKIGFAHVSIDHTRNVMNTYLPSEHYCLAISSIKTIFIDSGAQYFNFHSVGALEPHYVRIYDDQTRVRVKLLDSTGLIWPGDFSLIVDCNRVKEKEKRIGGLKNKTKQNRETVC